MMKQAVSTALLAALLLAAGCSDEKPDTEEPVAAPLQTSATDTAASPASPGGTALVPDVTSGTTVLVVLNDNSIAVKEQTIPPGPAVLTVENAGSDVHNLYIEGEGISRAAGDNIDKGKSATVDVVFKPGTYTLYCPILDHRKKGEETKITVGTGGTATSATTGTTGTTATTSTP